MIVCNMIPFNKRTAAVWSPDQRRLITNINIYFCRLSAGHRSSCKGGKESPDSIGQHTG